MNNFSVLECPVYFDKTNMLDMAFPFGGGGLSSARTV